MCRIHVFQKIPCHLQLREIDGLIIRLIKLVFGFKERFLNGSAIPWWFDHFPMIQAFSDSSAISWWFGHFTTVYSFYNGPVISRRFARFIMVQPFHDGSAFFLWFDHYAMVWSFLVCSFPRQKILPSPQVQLPYLLFQCTTINLLSKVLQTLYIPLKTLPKVNSKISLDTHHT